MSISIGLQQMMTFVAKTKECVHSMICMAHFIVLNKEKTTNSVSFNSVAGIEYLNLLPAKHFDRFTVPCYLFYTFASSHTVFISISLFTIEFLSISLRMCQFFFRSFTVPEFDVIQIHLTSATLQPF